MISQIKQNENSSKLKSFQEYVRLYSLNSNETHEEKAQWEHTRMQSAVFGLTK